MSSSTPKSPFWRGARDAAPLVVVVGPFAIVFSVLAIEQGLSLGQTMGFSTLVIAGAAQFAALQLMSESAPFVIVVAAALAVNLRMAMYSASLAPHLGPLPLGHRLLVAYFNVDQSYALSMAQYEDAPDMPLGAKLAYFLGTAVPILVVWVSASFAGAVAGAFLPESLALDFTVPITFLAIVSIMLRTLAHWCAATASVTAALLLYALPYNLGLLIAAAIAMAVGAAVETLREDRP